MTCPACGATASDTAPFCTACGARLARAVGAPSSAVSTPPPLPSDPAAPLAGAVGQAGARATAAATPVSVGPSPAPLLRRAVAALLDLLAFPAWLWFLGARAATRFGGWQPDGTYSLEGGASVIIIVQATLGWMATCALFEWVLGATPGKLATGIAVTRFSQKRPLLIQAVARNLLRPIDAFGVYVVGGVFALLSRNRQRLGDHLAQTLVVSRPPSAGLRALGVVLALAIPFGSVTATAALGYIHEATNRWVSGGSTRLHGEAKGVVGVQGKFGKEKSGKPVGEVNLIHEASGSGSVTHELAMRAVRLTAGKDGPERTTFDAGAPVGVTFEVHNAAASGANGQARIRIALRLLRPGGGEAAPAVVREDDVPGGRPVNRSVEYLLPAQAEAASYQLELVVDDLVVSRQLRALLPLTVKASR